MQSKVEASAEVLATYSRRSLWMALVLLLVLGAMALMINVFPDSELAGMVQPLAKFLPFVIAVAIAVLRSSLHGVRVDPAAPAMKAVLDDPLRQQSLQTAYKCGLFAVLLAQPVLAVLLMSTGAREPILLMASATALVGVVAVLATMLWLDR